MVALRKRKAKLKRRVKAKRRPVELLGFSINEFCDAYGFSPDFYFRRARLGEMPAVLQIGGRTILTREAIDEWRRAHEKQRAPSKPELESELEESEPALGSGPPVALG